MSRIIKTFFRWLSEFEKKSDAAFAEMDEIERREVLAFMNGENF